MMQLPDTENVKITLSFRQHTNRPLHCVLTLVTLLATTMVEGATIDLDGIAAIVDEDVILTSELEERLQMITSQMESRETILPDADLV